MRFSILPEPFEPIQSRSSIAGPRADILSSAISTPLESSGGLRGDMSAKPQKLRGLCRGARPKTARHGMVSSTMWRFR
jgi:hypothetical protein